MLTVLVTAEELARCHSLEALLRRTVELSRERIGLTRVSLFLCDEARGRLCGTWGTNAKGALVDERDVERPYGDIEREACRRLDAGVARWLHLRDAPLVSQNAGDAMLLERGWQVVTPVRSLRAPIGMLYNGAVFGEARPDPAQQERAAVFASLVGILIESAREPVQLAPLPKPRAKDGAVVRKAIALLNEDPTISANELAARLSVGSARLARAFRAELSVSLVQYRNRLRLERFFGLMERRGCSFSDAAQTAGFGSYAQFHRIFRQHVGLAPRQYLMTSRSAVER